jgi:hypothetical protein
MQGNGLFKVIAKRGVETEGRRKERKEEQVVVFNNQRNLFSSLR